MSSRAILFLNLGGPEKLSDVKSFLYRLFEDPEIIRIKFSPLRTFVAWLISTTRHKKSQGMYRLIGGGSPIRRLTDQQSEGVEKILKARNRDVWVRTAFTCSDPLVEDVVKDLAAEGVNKFLPFPLYPQYSFTTTKGAFDRPRAAVKRFAPAARLIEMPSFSTHPLFLEAHADLIRGETIKFPKPQDEEIHLIFSAHSIPKKLVTEEGDPYEKEMRETVKGVVDKVKWKGPWSLSWQSKLGPVEWLSPSTENTLIDLGEKGVKQVLIVPIAFVTDHIETLFEIDQMFAVTAKEAGIQEFHRTPGLNSHPKFLECLVELALSKKDLWN